MEIGFAGEGSFEGGLTYFEENDMLGDCRVWGMLVVHWVCSVYRDIKRSGR